MTVNDISDKTTISRVKFTNSGEVYTINTGYVESDHYSFIGNGNFDIDLDQSALYVSEHLVIDLPENNPSGDFFLCGRIGFKSKMFVDNGKRLVSGYLLTKDNTNMANYVNFSFNLDEVGNLFAIDRKDNDVKIFYNGNVIAQKTCPGTVDVLYLKHHNETNYLVIDNYILIQQSLNHGDSISNTFDKELFNVKSAILTSDDELYTTIEN